MLAEQVDRDGRTAVITISSMSASYSTYYNKA